MTINLINEQDLNDFIASIVYEQCRLSPISKEDLKNRNFIESHKDLIAKVMTDEWFKANIKDSFADDNDCLFLRRIIKAEDNSPAWLKKEIANGGKVYEFCSENMSFDFIREIEVVRDYLINLAKDNIDIVLRQQDNIRLDLNLLKQLTKVRASKDENHKDSIFSFVQGQALAWNKERKISSGTRENSKDVEFVSNLGNGFIAYKIKTSTGLDSESDMMGHCAGQGKYDDGVAQNTIQIYSIRDKKGVSHATLEVRDGKIMQCKGKANKAIVKKYVPYVYKFIQEQNLDPTNDLKRMHLCKDINGNVYSIYNIPKGRTFASLDISGEEVLTLPTGLKILGDLNVSNSSLRKLPMWLTVNGNLTMNDTNISTFPCNSIVYGNVIATNLKAMDSISNNMQVYGLFFIDYGIKSISSLISNDKIMGVTEQYKEQCKQVWKEYNTCTFTPSAEIYNRLYGSKRQPKPSSIFQAASYIRGLNTHSHTI